MRRRSSLWFRADTTQDTMNLAPPAKRPLTSAGSAPRSRNLLSPPLQRFQNEHIEHALDHVARRIIRCHGVTPLDRREKVQPLLSAVKRSRRELCMGAGR